MATNRKLEPVFEEYSSEANQILEEAGFPTVDILYAKKTWEKASQEFNDRLPKYSDDADKIANQVWIEALGKNRLIMPVTVARYRIASKLLGFLEYVPVEENPEKTMMDPYYRINMHLRHAYEAEQDLDFDSEEGKTLANADIAQLHEAAEVLFGKEIEKYKWSMDFTPEG